MKIFSNRFELTRPSEKRIYHSPNTIYGIGVRVEKNGEIQEGTVKLFENGVELTPMASTVDSYVIFQRTSGGEPTAKVLDCVYTKDGLVQSFKLIDTTTDSTVFDIDQSSGEFELPIASETVLGGIKVGEGLAIEADGTLNADIDVPTKTSDLENDSGFITEEDIPEVPVATTTTAGKVIVGSGLSVDADGKIDVTGGSSEETDPVFTAWKESNTGIQVGKNSSVTGTKGIAIGSGDSTSSSFITTASGSNSVAIGNGAQSDQSNNIAIGRSAKAQGTPVHIGLIAIGDSAKATSNNCTAVGRSSQATGQGSLAIGYDAVASGPYSIQIGEGTNSIEGTVKFRNFQILSSDGNIPSARLGAIPTAILSGTYSDDTEFSFTVYTKQA